MDFHAVLIERGRCRIGTKTDVHMDLIAAASGFLDLPARAAAWLILMPSAAPAPLLCSGTQVTQPPSDSARGRAVPLLSYPSTCWTDRRILGAFLALSLGLLRQLRSSPLRHSLSCLTSR